MSHTPNNRTKPGRSHARALASGMAIIAWAFASEADAAMTFIRVAETQPLDPSGAPAIVHVLAPAVSGTNIVFKAATRTRIVEPYGSAILMMRLSGGAPGMPPSATPLITVATHTSRTLQGTYMGNTVGSPRIDGDDVLLIRDNNIVVVASNGVLSERVRVGITVPPGEGNLLGNFGINNGNVSIHAGKAVFGAFVQGGTQGVGALYTSDPSRTMVPIARDVSTPIPGSNGASFTSFIIATPIMKGDAVAFKALYKPAPAFPGASAPTLTGYFTIRDGVVRSIIADHLPAPAWPGGGISRTLGQHAFNGTEIALHASYDQAAPGHGNQGIFKSEGSTFRAIATNGEAFDDVPGVPGSLFTGFGTLPSMSGDRIAFTATHTLGNGLFFWSETEGLNAVILSGAPLFGSTVSTVEIGTFGLDGNSLGFKYVLANNRSGIAFVTIPAPTSCCALLCAGVFATRRRRMTSARPTSGR